MKRGGADADNGMAHLVTFIQGASRKHQCSGEKRQGGHAAEARGTEKRGYSV
jgi:hypothetical protein